MGFQRLQQQSKARHGTAQVGPEGERGAAVAASVAALVAAAGCGNCLVWSKSDAFVTAYQRAAPTHALGYVVAADAADEALARPLRHSAPQARPRAAGRPARYADGLVAAQPPKRDLRPWRTRQISWLDWKVVSLVGMCFLVTRCASGRPSLTLVPLRAQVLAVHHAMLTPAVVDAARAAGKRVHAFVADTPGTAAAVLAAGVDGVVTSWPRRIALMAARLAACCEGDAGGGSCHATLRHSAARRSR